MQTRNLLFGLGVTVAAAGGLVTAAAIAQNNGEGEMSFFVTSIGSRDGGNLGGLEGADAHCQALAGAVGAGDQDWRAYLSTIDLGGGEGSNAGDRIGEGPWFNAEGVLIAANLHDLHTEGANNINKQTALTEAGAIVPGRGDSPNQHDILTGTLQDGTAADATCVNWTSSSADQSTFVGHTDLQGNPAGINFWNYSHGTRGCSQQGLVRTGGAGYFYCFALATDATARTPAEPEIDPALLLAELIDEGAVVYRQCRGCHGRDGEGQQEAMDAAPALAGNSALLSVGTIVSQVIRGGDSMPPFDSLTDRQIAAVATYIRNSFGNNYGIATEEEVANNR